MKKIFLLAWFAVGLVAQEITQEWVVENGKTLILVRKSQSLQSANASLSASLDEGVSVGQRKYFWIPHPQNRNKEILLLSIPYYTKEQSIGLQDGEILRISKGDYRFEQINVDSSKAKPNEANQQRIKEEREEANKIYGIYSRGHLWDKPFIHPTKSKITSEYGSARVFNGEIRSYHSGTDFRAAIGTPIYASNSGKVVIAKERFLAGKSVVIDHGEGIFSMYYHCSEIKVKVSDRVERGELIALSGNSGRVSGPHLHFGILVRGVQVDPLDFIARINAILE